MRPRHPIEHTGLAARTHLVMRRPPGRPTCNQTRHRHRPAVVRHRHELDASCIKEASAFERWNAPLYVHHALGFALDL
jgi:hypothetical protein